MIAVRRIFQLALWVPAAASAQSQSAPPLEMRVHEQRAGQLFDPAFVADGHSALSVASDNLLVMCQAVAAVIVVAGLIASIRKDHVQMESIAAMILKVAFIALVPMLRVQVLETADAAAGALGYHAAAGPGTPAAMTTSLWGLLGEWSPPGSPYLDALQTQAAEHPDSGQEEAWGLQAWNWARGVGTSTASAFDAAWQSTSGGMRAGFVFAGCAGAACVTAVTIALTYLTEILRYVLFFIGCAVLPVFIAALGIDSLRPLAQRFIILLVSIACWPVGWAIANGVTATMVGGLSTWMNSATAAALSLGASDPVPALSVAAPYVGWSGLIVFGGGTIAICAWAAGTVLLAPLAIGRVVSAAGGFVAAGFGLMAAHGVGVATAARASGPRRASGATGVDFPTPRAAVPSGQMRLFRLPMRASAMDVAMTPVAGFRPSSSIRLGRIGAGESSGSRFHLPLSESAAGQDREKMRTKGALPQWLPRPPLRPR